MQTTIDSCEMLLKPLACRYAFYFEAAGHNPVQAANCQRFRSASIIKVPILLAWAWLERAGEVDQGEICDLDAEPPVRGSGFAWRMQARRLPYHDVLLMMIATSDNLCTNLVIRRIGMKRLQAIIHDALDLPGAELQRRLMDYEARAKGLDNFVSPAALIRCFELVDGLPAEQKTWVDAMLVCNQDAALLARDHPRDTLDFYHKTGSMDGVLNDWGYTRDRRIFLLTEGFSAELPVFEVFGRLGRLLLEG
ncbi:beta-lactamase class A [Longilinea arvoryzae]|uniref:Beta-lactamase class A n=1 Tax=Longilinea arvoryzae TaxID=360412 RepID=A0A0S7B5R7_9CHLR|nr:serine hydrolase [Longilinea arvoryzae]GAP12295.1 beta-lactamase class A [Longilinea arvoryzae]